MQRLRSSGSVSITCVLTIFRCKPLLTIKQWERVKSYKISKRSLIHNTIRLTSIMISIMKAGICQPLLVYLIPELQHCQPFPDDKRDLLAFSISSNSFIMSLRNVFLVFSSTSKMERYGFRSSNSINRSLPSAVLQASTL